MEKGDPEQQATLALTRELRVAMQKLSASHQVMLEMARVLGEHLNRLAVQEPDGDRLSIARNGIHPQDALLMQLFAIHWPQISATIDREKAAAKAGGHPYCYPTPREALRKLGVLPALPNNGVVLPDDPLVRRVLQQVERSTGYSVAQLSYNYALQRRGITYEDLTALRKGRLADLETIMEIIGVLPPLTIPSVARERLS